MKKNKIIIILFLCITMVLCTSAFGGSTKNTAKKETRNNKTKPGFQDIPFGTTYDEVKQKLLTKYLSILLEKDDFITLGKIDTLWSKEPIAFTLGDLNTTVTFIFQTNRFIAYQINACFALRETVPRFNYFKGLTTLNSIFEELYGEPSYLLHDDVYNLYHDFKDAMITLASNHQLNNRPDTYILAAIWQKTNINAYVGLYLPKNSETLYAFGSVYDKNHDSMETYFLTSPQYIKFKNQFLKQQEHDNQIKDSARQF